MLIELKLVSTNLMHGGPEGWRKSGDTAELKLTAAEPRLLTQVSKIWQANLKSSWAQSCSAL